MKFSANLNIHGLQHFVECLLCLNKLCKELSSTSLPYLKLTHDRISIIIKTNGLIDSYLEIDSTELFQCPFVLESQTNNVIVLEVDITSLYDALNSATRSEHITIKLIKYVLPSLKSPRYRGGFLSVKFTDPIYPTIVITLDVPVNPINEDINRNSVIPVIPPCSWNIGLSKLQSITYFLESVYKIGNDLVEFQVIRNRYTQNDAVSVDGSVFYSSTLKLRSFGNIADLETIFHGLHIFSSLPGLRNVCNTKLCRPRTYSRRK
ncbi:Fe/Mn superoxide dismutase, putative [Theileria equi strain WA]|uniref:Fe/Mn superoxide dismutase, putative n=1 Tax=Theileria equi strain WA TaxID=1537102 RepID=L0AYQ7_THEEQ|nr:Fe/Mn superoxide dismutase, putative [Theileria equi strain WA]AFZ80727.1 Fe/Mn superoxide dismutase, putative [Theileria equi strain WA]|eukprot:XP_004830393.1 Fe/Mn superoxide dismutase, putative [Theileria equi strain WA]